MTRGVRPGNLSVQALLALSPTTLEERSWLFGLRLLASLLIAGSIVRKYRRL